MAQKYNLSSWHPRFLGTAPQITWHLVAERRKLGDERRKLGDERRNMGGK